MNICKLIASFILVSCFSSFSQEQSHYKAFYLLDILRDTNTLEYFRQEIYILQIGENVTKGFTYQKFYNDSLQAANPALWRKLFNASVQESMEAMRRTGDLTSVQNNEFTVGAFASDLYKDYRNNEIRVRDNISIHSFMYTDELKPQEWTILSDTMTILGYPSQKALCHFRGRDWEAWFTPEIPISEGPWKFYGLPGLVTKLHDIQNHYSFELTGFQRINESIDTKIPTATQKIERKEFLRTKYGEKGTRISQADMDRVGIVNNAPVTRHYDPIERDY